MHNKILSTFFKYSILLCVTLNAIQIATEVVDSSDKENYANELIEKLKELIEKVRSDMKNKQGLFENITIDPLIVEHQSFNINHSIGEFHGYMDNIELKHLTDFQVDIEKFNVIMYNLKATFNFSELTSKNGDYKVDGFIGSPPLFKLFGDGKFNLSLINFQVKIDTKLGYKNKQFYFKKISLDVSMEKMESYFQNLFGGGELEVEFNKVINQVAPFALEQLWPEIKPMAEKKAMEVGNEVIKHLNLSSILKHS